MRTLPVHRLFLPAAALVASAWFAPAALAATTDTIDKTFAGAGGADLEKSRGRPRATSNGGGPTIALTSSGGGISIDAPRGVGG